jgi:phage tail sheath gpL-like
MLQVGISTTDTPTTIATNLLAELATMADLPVSYTAAAGVVTFKALNKGTVGNQINLNASITAPGVTATATAMTGGAVDPNLAAALAVCFPGNYSIYAVPYIDQTNLQTLRTQVEAVSAYNQQRGAIGVYGFTGALAAATTLAGEINDGRMLEAYLPGSFSAPFEIAAAMAAVIASSTDPAMPLNTLELAGINSPPLADYLTQTEIESLLWNGVTPLKVDADQNVAIVRAVSTYTTNSSGIADPSLLDITTIRSLDYVRLACRTVIGLRFPRSKNPPGMAAKVRSTLLTTLLQLEGLEIVENVEANAAGLLVEQDSQTNTQLDAKIPAAVVPGLHVLAGRIDLLLQ